MLSSDSLSNPATKGGTSRPAFLVLLDAAVNKPTKPTKRPGGDVPTSEALAAFVKSCTYPSSFFVGGGGTAVTAVVPSASTNDIVLHRSGGGRCLFSVQLAMLLASWCHWCPGWKLDAVLEKTFTLLACSVRFNDWCGMALVDSVLLAAVAPVKAVAIAEATATDDASGRMQGGRLRMLLLPVLFVLQSGFGLCTMSVASCRAAGGNPVVGKRAFVKDTATTIPP